MMYLLGAIVVLAVCVYGLVYVSAGKAHRKEWKVW
jgi:hypothetical protein